MDSNTTDRAAMSLVIFCDDDGVERRRVVATADLTAFIEAIEAEGAYNVDWQDWGGAS